MKLILEFSEFNWKVDIVKYTTSAFADIISDYDIKPSVTFGEWMYDLGGFYVKRVSSELRRLSPEKAINSKPCISIALYNSVLQGTDDYMKLRQDDNLPGEIDRACGILRDELERYINIIDFRIPEKIEKTWWSVQIYIIYEEK